MLPLLLLLPLPLLLPVEGAAQGRGAGAPDGWCETGRMYQGPTCYTYYTCRLDQWGQASLSLARCGTGTAFDASFGVCVHYHPRLCQSAPRPPTLTPPPAPRPPTLTPPPTPRPPLETAPLRPLHPSPPSPPSKLPLILPLQPASTSPPTPAPFPNPAPSSIPPPLFPTSSCKKYTLDPTSIVNCTEEGNWDHPGRCDSFYRCVHTMNCILKGFQFRCPENHKYSTVSASCVRLSQPEPCFKASDSIGGPLYPVITLKEDQLLGFQAASVYWQMMPYLQEDPLPLIQLP